MRALIVYSANAAKKNLNSAIGDMTDVQRWLERAAESGGSNEKNISSAALMEKAKQLETAFSQLNDINNYLIALVNIYDHE